MVVAGLATLPLWLLGVAVAVVVYIALAYLAVSGLRNVAALLTGARRRRLDAGRARLYDGQAQPTLLEVAVARSSPAPRPASGERRRAA